MKKLFTTLFVAGALALTACSANIIKSDSSKSKLEGKGYSVEVYAEAEAKARIQNLNYDDVEFVDAVIASKGTGADADVFLGFYFKSVDAASKFIEKDNYHNLALMNSWLENMLGENLETEVGSHNNVAYAASKTSAAIAIK